MTTDEFMALPVEKKNALVAEKVMGFIMIYSDASKYGCQMFIKKRGDRPFAFSPTEEIGAAWEVVEKFRSEGKSWVLSWDAHELCKDYRMANFVEELDWPVLFCRGWAKGPCIEETAPTAPLAICLAALRAKGVLGNPGTPSEAKGVVE
jgi:hypothetical protein